MAKTSFPFANTECEKNEIDQNNNLIDFDSRKSQDERIHTLKTVIFNLKTNHV